MQVGQVSTPTANVTQALQKTTDAQKMDDVAALLLEEARQAESSGQQMPLTIIFVERKARCDDVAELLRTEGLSALALHGGLSQWEREGALRDFTKGDVRVSISAQQISIFLLVATVCTGAASFSWLALLHFCCSCCHGVLLVVQISPFAAAEHEYVLFVHTQALHQLLPCTAAIYGSLAVPWNLRLNAWGVCRYLLQQMWPAEGWMSRALLTL